MEIKKKNYREYKLYEAVRVIYTQAEGYIDAITPDKRYVVKLPGTYQWCRWYDIEPKDAPKAEEKRISINKFDYL